MRRPLFHRLRARLPGLLLAAALPGCRSDLVAQFDCRFMPFAIFLKRTLGFFSDSRVAMVQTPLTFFRSEFYNRNLGADQVMPGERDLFFHYGEVVLDRFNSVQACGGSSVIRTSSTDAAGGPSWSAAMSASMASGDPSASSSTHPSARFITQPSSRRPEALRSTKRRKPTPWTTPRTTAPIRRRSTVTPRSAVALTPPVSCAAT